MSREQLVDRFLQLRPGLHRLLSIKAVPSDLRQDVPSVTLHQLEALERLCPSGLTMGALAQALSITDGSAAVLSDRLVKHGLAVRRTDLNDRRVVWLELSESAPALLQRFQFLERQAVAAGLHTLDDCELSTLLDLIEKLAAGISNRDGGKT